MKRTLSQELIERGLIYQFNRDSLEEILDHEKRHAYLGVDPSADSIHVGNLVTYIMTQHLRNYGHKVTLLIGGATGLVGDPSFKDEEREIVSPEIIASRAKNIKEQIQNIKGLESMEIVNNYDWFKEMNTLEFLRDVGKHFNIGTMIKRESVKKRIEGENGISYAEFSYALIQGYDYFHLYQTRGCNLQVGGSDQWGNILSGVDFIRRKAGENVFAITLPLIVDKATGKKFGKSEGNAVWLNPEKTSPYEFYQFWINTDDVAAVDYMKKFTFLALEEISEYEKKTKENPELRETQKRLAYEVTNFVHGTEITDSVVKVTEVLFGDQTLEDINNITKEIIVKEAPTYKITKDENIVELLVNTELASSNREAREFINNKAITLDTKVLESTETNIKDVFTTEMAMLRRGKKKYCVLMK